MGTGAIAGVPVRGAEAVLGAGPIRAYHGSPHDFDAFDLSKIGTGEGAQAYGHGLYFAEREGVAKAYRDQLAQRTIDDKPVTELASVYNSHTPYSGKPDPGLEHKVAAYLQDYNTPEHARLMMDRRGHWDAMEMLDKMVADGRIKSGGKMYEVNINADPAHFLDWDKPLSGQSDAVRQALKLDQLPQKPSSEETMAIFKKAKELGVPANTLPEYKALEARMDSANSDAWNAFGINPSNVHARPEDLTGSQFVQALEQKMLGPDVYGGKSPAASNTLREAGIPGIKYLDQGSRSTDASRKVIEETYDLLKNTSQGPEWAKKLAEINASPPPSSNYVVFNDKLIDIMRKYGIAGAIGAGGMGALAAQDEYR